MRIARLVLGRYGHFSGRTLEFARSEGRPDLHVVFGVNEAGKSVFRKSLYDFLFGFGSQTFANFNCDYSDLSLTGELENEENGQTLHCERRKRNRNSLLDADGRPLAQRQLDEWLAGVTRGQYETEFAIDQPQMEKSGASLLKSGERLFYAMFSAVSGMDAVFAVHQQLRQQCDRSWRKDQRHATRYRQMQADFKDSSLKLRELVLDLQARRQVNERLAGAQEAIDEISARHNKRREDASRIVVLDKVEDILGKIDANRTLLAGARAEEAGQEGVLAAAARIEGLKRQQALAAAAEKEAARLAVEQDQAQAKIDALAAGLGISGKDIAAQIPDRAKRGQLAELAHEMAHARRMAQELSSELASARAQFAAAVHELRPWQGKAEEFARLQPPARSECRSDQQEMQRLSAAAEACRDRLADAQGELAKLQERIGNAGAAGKAVARDAVEQARKERDEKFASLIDSSQPRRHAADYLLKVRRADELADARLENAEESALLDEQAEQVGVWRAKVARHERQHGEALAAVARFRGLWEEKMKSCSLAGLEIERYGDWHDNYEQAREHALGIRRLESRLAGVKPEAAAEYDRLRAECALAGIDDAKEVLRAVDVMGDIERELENLRKAKIVGSEKLALVQEFAAAAAKLADEFAVAADAPTQVTDRLDALLRQAVARQAETQSRQESQKQLLAELAAIEQGCDEQQWRKKIEAYPASARRVREREIEREEKDHQQALVAAVAAQTGIERESADYGRDDEAAANARQVQHQALVGMAEAVGGHIRAKTALAVLHEALTRYQAQADGGRDLLAAAGEYLARITGSRYRGLEYDDEKLLAVRRDAKLGLEQLSAGTRDQVYLSLRLAGVSQQARCGPSLPFVADDLFASFDDERCRAGFEVLAEIARCTQIIFLTHHEHLLALARRALPGISEMRL